MFASHRALPTPSILHPLPPHPKKTCNGNPLPPDPHLPPGEILPQVRVPASPPPPWQQTTRYRPAAGCGMPRAASAPWRPSHTGGGMLHVRGSFRRSAMRGALTFGCCLCRFTRHCYIFPLCFFSAPHRPCDRPLGEPVCRGCGIRRRGGVEASAVVCPPLRPPRPCHPENSR